MPRWLPALPAKLSHRRWRYWLISLTILIACSWANPHIQEFEAVKSLRYSVFQWLAEHGTLQPNQTRDITVIQINDDVFSNPKFKFVGKTPTNREALGDLMRAVALHQPLGIVLDFRMPLEYGTRKDTNWSSKDIGDYSLIGGDAELKRQTRSLVNAARDIANSGDAASPGIKVIFARTKGDGPHLGGDAPALFGLCDRLQPGFAISEKGDLSANPWRHAPVPDFKLTDRASQNITCAHLHLYREDDLQTIPETFDITIPEPPGHTKLISFAMEISRLKGQGWPKLGELPYFAQHLHPERAKGGQNESDVDYPTREKCTEQFKTVQFVISAYCLLNKDSAPSATGLTDPMAGKFVIIGANWSDDSAGPGRRRDSHTTSIGEVNGARLHQSYAEALIGGTWYYTVSERIYLMLDITVGLIVIILLSASLNRTRTVLRLLAIFATLFGAEMLILMRLHSYVDMLVPFCGLALHTLIERLIEGGHHGEDHHGGEAPAPIPAGLTGQQDS